MSTKVSVILPTYNEWGNVKNLIPEIVKQFQTVSINNYEIIVVDDDSLDKTGKNLKKKYKGNQNIKVLIRKKSNGLAGSILDGINMSKGEIVIGMDADGNHDPKVLPVMIEEISESDFVLASRFIQGGGMDEKIRYIFTAIFNWWLRVFLRFPTSDNMSGYYAINRNVLNSLPLKNIYRGYGDYHLRLMWALKILNKKIVEVPTYYKKRLYGKSKSNLLQMLQNYSVEAVRLSRVRLIDEI